MSQKPYPSFRTHFILILSTLSLGLSSVSSSVFASSTDTYYLYAQSPSSEQAPPPEGSYVPHELVIYFKSSCSPHTPMSKWACAEPQSSSIRLSLLSMFTRIKVAMGLSVESTTHSPHMEQLQALNTKYGLIESTRLTDDDPELDSSPYIYRFREGVSLQEARLAYENLKEVLYVQYNYIYTLP